MFDYTKFEQCEYEVWILALFDYTKFEQYEYEVWILALIALGIVFFIFGLVMSKIFRPGNHDIQQETHNLKKRLLDDLNTSKKFNADYQLLAKRDKTSE